MTKVRLSLVELPAVSPAMASTVKSLWQAPWRWHLRRCHC